MEPAFWRQRWQANKIGFHLEEVNPYLIEHWPRLAIAEGARVFVPLCGKSVDMRWLLEQGYQVEAIELSELAIEQFFAEQGLDYAKEESESDEYDGWLSFKAANIRIWCGDFFELSKEQIGPIDAVYDRAALIALPEEMRRAYVQQLLTLTGPVPQFLITLNYDQGQMEGPPFAVSNSEVNGLYQAAYGEITGPDVEIDVLPGHGHFAARGLTGLHECVYLLPAATQVSKK